MSKAVLYSIRPEYCKLILDRKKTVEVRKSIPKLDVPFKCYIYCTYGFGLIEYKDEVLPNHLLSQKVTANKKWDNCCNGKVIGEFICDEIYQYSTGNIEGINISEEDMKTMSCLTRQELIDYEFSSSPKDFCMYRVGLYGLHIFNLVIYDEPKELTSFYRPCPYEENDDISCYLCDKSGRRPDNADLDCFYYCEKPPQSWYYVEELSGA